MKKQRIFACLTAVAGLGVLGACSNNGIEDTCSFQHDYGCPPYEEERTVAAGSSVQEVVEQTVVVQPPPPAPAPAPEPVVVVAPEPEPMPMPDDTMIMTTAPEPVYTK